MKKVRLIPFILAMSLPLTGCSFDDVMFWKKSSSSTPTQQQPETPEEPEKPGGEDLRVTGIVKVIVQETIVQNATLSIEEVEIEISLSDGRTDTVHPERVELDTSTLGKTTGTVFYNPFFKNFEIEVVEAPEAVPVEIEYVSTPPTIRQGEELELSEVDIRVVYSDGRKFKTRPTRIELDTSAVGTVTGTVYFGDLSKTFEIQVLAKNGQDPGPTFEEIKKDILKNHNYTINIESYYPEHPEDRFEGMMANLNDEVYYGNDPEYPNLFYSGYIKVKDQGISSFHLAFDAEDVVLDEFVCTNTELDISDIHGGLLEDVLSGETIEIEEDHYRIYDQELVKIVGSYANIELAYVSAPEYVDIYKDYDELSISCVLTANYYDEETLNPVTEPINVILRVRHIGRTKNEILESFVSDESSKAVAPVYWNAQLLASFISYYGEYIPPFIEGASYAFNYNIKWVGYKQRYEIQIQDLASNDLTKSYGEALTNEDFVKSEEEGNVYTKTVLNEEETLASIFTVEMTYLSPAYILPGSEVPAGYYYPEGVMQLIFTMSTKVVEKVTSIELLNAYLGTTNAANIIPLFPTLGVSKISGFDDRTEANNQLHGGFLFCTKTTDYFNIYIPSYEDACSFYDQYLLALALKGFDHVESDDGWHISFITDEKNSKITITKPSSFTKEDYEAQGYLQCRIVIYDMYGEVPSVNAHSITYHAVDSNGNPIDALALTSSLPEKGEKGDEITANIIAKEGYSYVEWYFPFDYFEIEEFVDYFNTHDEYDPTSSYFKFPMLDQDMDIYLVFEEDANPQTYSVSFSKDEGVASLTHEDLSGVKLGEEVSFSIDLKEGYRIKSVTSSPSVSFSISDSTYSFVMPKSDVSISIETEEILDEPEYVVTIVKDEGVGFVNKSNPADFTKVVEGTVVAFSFSVNEGYELVSVTCSDSSVEVTKNPLSSTGYYFTMPDHDVSISIVTQSTGGSQQEVFQTGHDYVTYVKSDLTELDEAPDAAHSKLILNFGTDGKGTYIRETYGSTHNKNATYTMTFTYTYNESTGKITMYYFSGNVTDFASFRLFTGSDSSKGNDTGLFFEGQISIMLVDKNENGKVYTFK